VGEGLDDDGWPGNVCEVFVLGLGAKCEAGPTAESGDSVLPLLMRRLEEDGVPSGSVGLSMECTPRSLLGPDLQSSVGVPA